MLMQIFLLLHHHHHHHHHLLLLVSFIDSFFYELFYSTFYGYWLITLCIIGVVDNTTVTSASATTGVAVDGVANNTAATSTTDISKTAETTVANLHDHADDDDDDDDANETTRVWLSKDKIEVNGFFMKADHYFDKNLNWNYGEQLIIKFKKYPKNKKKEPKFPDLIYVNGSSSPRYELVGYTVDDKIAIYDMLNGVRVNNMKLASKPAPNAKYLKSSTEDDVADDNTAATSTTDVVNNPSVVITTVAGKLYLFSIHTLIHLMYYLITLCTIYKLQMLILIKGFRQLRVLMEAFIKLGGRNLISSKKRLLF